MPKIWFINETGSAREADISDKDKLVSEKGWIVIPPDKLDSYGRPKQMYFPQYDKNNPAREKRITTEDTPLKDILKVEVF